MNMTVRGLYAKKVKSCVKECEAVTKTGSREIRIYRR